MMHLGLNKFQHFTTVYIHTMRTLKKYVGDAKAKSSAHPMTSSKHDHCKTWNHYPWNGAVKCLNIREIKWLATHIQLEWIHKLYKIKWVQMLLIYTDITMYIDQSIWWIKSIAPNTNTVLCEISWISQTKSLSIYWMYQYVKKNTALTAGTPECSKINYSIVYCLIPDKGSLFLYHYKHHFFLFDHVYQIGIV